MMYGLGDTPTTTTNPVIQNIGTTNFQTDPLNCGSAGNVCPDGYTCSGGVCTTGTTTTTGGLDTASALALALLAIFLFQRGPA